MGATVLLAHGSGGLMARELLEGLFLRHLGDSELHALEDAAVLDPVDGRLALTTDSYVVQPLFFPGGDIGKLAVCGTVNDLAMRGAVPLYLTVGFILEEGLPMDDLERVVASLAATAREADVRIVAGDTKVVGRGAADRLFVNTAGAGIVPPGIQISARNARPGDQVLVNGAVGDHGLAIMTQRHGLRFESPIQSDCAPLSGLVQAMLTACPSVHVLRDATRGGLAAVLNEIAGQSRVGITVHEGAIVIHEAVAAACEVLGLDPLYAANEGKLVAIVPGDAATTVLDVMRAHPLGAEAAIIGEIETAHPGAVVLRTAFGTQRLLDMPAGELLPRIC
ncbi:MAG: hydrogenase expression/formation protein HypE [Anaerolineae bacterium]|jgi:hydrogenase expression/formation protein HypE